MKSSLIIGYGNPDRQDDGAALHILVKLAGWLNRPLETPLEDNFYPLGDNPDMWFSLQLLPEMAETVSRYDRVCFLDAHTGNIPQDIQAIPIEAAYQPSPLTHHMTASTFLSLCQALNHCAPEAILISVRGYQFGFSRSLSPQTEHLVDEACMAVQNWLNIE